jgi:V/A-type H+-transporting ATPase subunit C
MRYGFAVGKVRVLETRTLDRSAFERLLDAASFQEQRRILSETVYGLYIERAETTEDVEVGLETALDDFHTLLHEAALPDAFVRFFELRADYSNLKSAVKARVLGMPLDGMLARRGQIPAERFFDEPETWPHPFDRIAKQLLGEEIDDQSLHRIDAAIDKAQFAALHEAAREAESPFLQQVAALLSDIANTKVIVRAKAAGLPQAEVEQMLVGGGEVTPGKLLSLYARSPAELAAGLEGIPSMRGIATEGIAERGAVDVVTDNALMRLLRSSRRVSSGPEPVIAYVLAREAEVQALRVLLLGKLAGLDPEAMRHRLRDTYR